MSACDNNDISEHETSLTTAMMSMSIDKLAKKFVASFHRWITSVISGLSQVSADMYTRHTARYVEGLSGCYINLAKKGAHLDKLHKVHKPMSVKAVLWASIERSCSDSQQ